MSSENKNIKHYTIYVEPELKEKIKKYAKVELRPMTNFVVNAVETYIRQNYENESNNKSL